MEKEVDKVLVWYYLNGEEILNFGEHLTEVIVNELGYDTVCYDAIKDTPEIENYEACLIIIGSELHRKTFDHLNIPKILVWGQGKGISGPDYEVDLKEEPYQSKVKIYSVRGPLTIRNLNLDPATITGDPGFAMPLIFPKDNVNSSDEIIYIAHLSNKVEDKDAEAKKIGATRAITIMMPKDDFWKNFDAIVNAKFILTSSLHVSIVCWAYGVPFALYLSEGETLDKPEKWQDIFEFLGLEGTPQTVSNYEEGKVWWDSVGSKAVVPNMIPMLKAFPYPIKNERVLKTIEGE